MKILKTANFKKLAVFGTFKYKCDECGEITYLTRQDRNKRSIPRCRFCGSTWLDPVTETAKNKMLDIHDEYDKNIDLYQDKTNFKRKMENISLI